MAIPASSPKYEETQQGEIIVKRNPVPAVGAMRTGKDNRFPAGHPVYYYVQETPDTETKEEQGYREGYIEDNHLTQEHPATSFWAGAPSEYIVVRPPLTVMLSSARL